MTDDEELTYGDGVVVTTQVHGLTLRLAAYNRAMRLCARMNYETENLDFVDRMPEGAVFYDLGACEGRFATYAALRGLAVYAFEPEAMNFSALMDNRALNGPRASANLRAFNVGVGAATGTAVLKIGQPWAGGHHKVVELGPGRKDLDFEFTGRQEIQIVALDDIIVRERLPAPNYLKVDVDGSEIPFLQGATRAIGNPALRGILFELCRTDASHDEVVRTLTAQGFAVTGEFQVEPGLYNVLFERRVGS